ncbi:MAG: antibiotic biosynthesis monooxygenase [Robiginitomaculum sp.]|nr:MAG: antibiotic biosynthesis monooxygenase [Robiginitomaculum sp.]
MGKITLDGYIIVPASDLEAIKAALVIHIRLTREERVCMEFKVVQDSQNPHRFSVYEEFENEDVFKAHQTRVASSDWGRIAKHVERHYTITTE